MKIENQNENIYDEDHFDEKCVNSMPHDKRGKVCTKCERWKRNDGFHKNKSKGDGLECRCKECVSLIKAKNYARKKRFKSLGHKTHESFKSIVEGEVSDDLVLEFTKVFREVYKGLRYEGKI